MPEENKNKQDWMFDNQDANIFVNNDENIDIQNQTFDQWLKSDQQVTPEDKDMLFKQMESEVQQPIQQEVEPEQPVENVVENQEINNQEFEGNQNFESNEQIVDNANVENYVEETENIQPVNNDIMGENFGLNNENVNMEEGSEEWDESLKIDFSSNAVTKKVIKKRNYHKINWFLGGFIFLAIVVLALLFGYGLYFSGSLKQASETSEYEKKAIEYYDSAVDFLEWYINVSNSDNYDYAIENFNVDDIVYANDLSYINKKVLMDQLVVNLGNKIMNNYNLLNEKKTDLTKYAFLPTELNFSEDNEYDINTVESSLLALESIKFGSAMSVFRYLDSFLNSLVSSTRISKTQIQEKIDDILDRWEKDIDLYIKKCYLNPYETNYNCNLIRDWDNYYSLIEEDSGIDTSFMKTLMQAIDMKLEQSTLPSFSILFQTFDNNNENLSFDVEIDTLPSDEEELSKQGILEPHVFILTQLVNTLKQSRFIIWDYIRIDSLDVEPEIITVWNTEFTVNSSSKSFTVPIKKESEIGIYDFVSN